MIEIPFGSGIAILLDTRVSFRGFTSADVKDGNRRWIERLASIHEAWEKRPALTLAQPPLMR